MEYAVVSRDLHEEVLPFFLRVIRSSSFHEKIIFPLAVHVGAPPTPVLQQISPKNVIFDMKGKIRERDERQG